MSRKDENDMMVKNLSTSFNGTAEEGKLFLLGSMSAILIDISKSLAVIADKLKEEGDEK